MLTIIPPEIKNDDFYYQIIKIIKSNIDDIKNIIEIGASSGEGSTEAIMTAISDTDINLYTFEVNLDRFSKLQQNYKNYPNIIPLNYSSINIKEYSSFIDIIKFYNSVKTNLNNYNLTQISEWYNEEIKYIKSNNIPEDGINFIKQSKNIEKFDVCVLDGSEFTGYQEFKLLSNSKFIFIDDINAFKHYNTHEYLSNNNNYKLIYKNIKLRNGFSMWENLS